MATHTGTATWEGTVRGGKGSFRTESGVSGTETFLSRFDHARGSSPEELIASAHASCFSMALTGALERAGKLPRRIDTEARCSVEYEDEQRAYQITAMKLLVKANVPGLDNATFQRIAAATRDVCPVSRALQPSVKLEIEAQLM